MSLVPRRAPEWRRLPAVDAAAVLASHRAADYCYCASEPHPWHCYECGQVWLGDAETGGCEAVLLARRVIALEAALAKWERWANPPFVPGAAWPVGEE
jgi:hypothetical protein